MSLYVHRFKDRGVVRSEMVFCRRWLDPTVMLVPVAIVWSTSSLTFDISRAFSPHIIAACWIFLFLGTIRCRLSRWFCPCGNSLNSDIFCSPLNSMLTYFQRDSSVFPTRASLGLGEPRRADMWWVLQCSPQPGEAQLTSPPPDAHTMARHATAGTKAKHKMYFSDIEVFAQHCWRIFFFRVTVGLSYTVQEEIKKHCVGFFHFIFTPDGSNIVRQWRKFNLGALSPGSNLCDEWQTQSQPSGQTAVSHSCVRMKMPIVFTRRSIWLINRDYCWTFHLTCSTESLMNPSLPVFS